MSTDSDAPIQQITTDPNDGDRSKIVPANNPYLQKISQMKPEIGQYLLKDKMGLFCGVSDPDKVYGVLQTGVIGDSMHIQHKGDWFDTIALKLTTKLVTEVKEGFYEVSLFQGDNVIHHTGLRFHSDFTKQTFLLDVQSFCSDLSFTPIFREEPNPPYKYHAIGHVYLSQGLLELLSQIKSQKYGAMNNCRDSLVSALVICQFWNASLGIPQCLNITEAISFMKEVLDHDHWLLWYLTFGLYSNSKAEERRKEVFGLLDQLAAFSFYDDSIAKMKELGILGDVKMFEVVGAAKSAEVANSSASA